VDLVFRPNDRHLIGPLQFDDRALRHEEGVRLHLGKHANPRELSRAQNISRIRK
jgi:hypothetical protein